MVGKTRWPGVKDGATDREVARPAADTMSDMLTGVVLPRPSMCSPRIVEAAAMEGRGLSWGELVAAGRAA